MSSELDRELFEHQNRHAGRWVIVRTDRAGVHFGLLRVTNGRGYVSLERARRIWEWYGAFTIDELSQDGFDTSRSKLSREVPDRDLQDAIEVIPCSDSVAETLRTLRSWVPK